MSLQKAKIIADRLLAAGATHCRLVGGFVRDHLMGRPSQDIDIEVFGLRYGQIANALDGDFRVDVVGQSFGVAKVDNEIDISLPRSESKCGVGHTDFAVMFDPTMTPRDAAARRDFTINSLAMDFDGQIFDPFNGREDLDRKILRATSEAFKEDPLRVLRGMQFAARFGFEMEAETREMCRDLSGEFPSLARERVWDEWWKWATKGNLPSKGLDVLRETGWTAHFPVLQSMIETPQDPRWHPEGDVYAHTGHSCDAAAEIADREGFDPRDRGLLSLAVLAHDFGKTTTTVRNDSGRRISPGHASAGATLTAEFLHELHAPRWIADHVVPLVDQHMAHMSHAEGTPPSARMIRRLAERLAPATIRMWAAVVEADASGRPPKPRKNPVSVWVSAADALALAEGGPQPILMGRHLVSLGYSPSPRMGEVLQAAFEAQLDGEFETVAGSQAWAQANFAVE